jgi:alkyl sulfatase BDS1-like metallo-beta-lactamase superfamily hydrolase
MHMFYPGLRALNLAENATHNLHNIYPLRGAQVRDANAWAKYLNEARDRFAAKADVVFAQHHWPIWGNARLLDYLAKQRDAYKYLHDQTLKLMNHGWTAADIAERLRCPRSLAREWHVRGYYGTFSHNAKAVYQRYLGWYDANPAHLNPLPPRERSKKTIAYMGGAAAAIERARQDFAAGEYRWVADVMSQVVFAEPDNWQARRLGDKAEGRSISVNWRFTDTAQRYLLTLENCALTYLSERQGEGADATVELARATLNRLILRELTLSEAIADGRIIISGQATKVAELFALFDDFTMDFEVVEPLRGRG